MTQPLIPATVIGSWSFPGWYERVLADVAAHPDAFGSHDRDELVRDAVTVAVADQVAAGLDRITDGEMQRVDFNLGFYDHLTGLQPLLQARRLGPPAHDQRSKYTAVARIKAPKGLGLVDEYRRFRALAPPDVACKVPVPGPFTLAGCIGTGGVYKHRKDVTDDLIPIVNAELKALAAEGADFLQLDEPSFACHPADAEYFLDVIARTVHGVPAYLSMHMCFGNYRARAVGWRSYRPLFPHIGQAKVQQLALEFASREMSELELLAELPASMDVAIGVVDVKNTWVEPRTLVADRIRQALKYIEPARLSVTPDCGFSQTARHVALAKAHELAQGARIVRRELTGETTP